MARFASPGPSIVTLRVIPGRLEVRFIVPLTPKVILSNVRPAFDSAMAHLRVPSVPSSSRDVTTILSTAWAGSSTPNIGKNANESAANARNDVLMSSS